MRISNITKAITIKYDLPLVAFSVGELLTLFSVGITEKKNTILYYNKNRKKSQKQHPKMINKLWLLK